MNAGINNINTRLIQMQIYPGQPAKNAAAMVEYIKTARTDGIELIIFSEMAIPGYLLGDEWEREAFLKDCEKGLESVRTACTDITAVFGSVGIDWNKRNEDGRVRKYNALFVVEDGVLLSPENSPYDFAIKTLLPNYREFDDSRHFFSLPALAREEGKTAEELITPITTSRLKLGCVLCEDAWDADYDISPLNILVEKGAEILINISASPFTANKNHKRNRVFSEHASSMKKPMIYVNHTGIQNNGKTVFTFDGASSVYDSKGHRLECGNPFEDSELTIDIPFGDDPPTFGTYNDLKEDDIAEIYSALHYGTEQFMKLCGVKKVIVGVSGGIDSAVVAAIYGRILPADRLLLVNMPSRFNSSTTIELAASLAENIGCYYTDIPIEDSIELTRQQIHELEISNSSGSTRETLRVNDFVMENIQARDRSSRILAGVSAAFGGVFTCNANKSEATVGYATLYGDLSGYLANIADLWKTEVYRLAEHINDTIYGTELIPRGVMTIPPSAELSAAQNVDEGKGDPLVYPYHDLLFKSWVEWWNRTTPEEILSWHLEETLETKLGYEGSIREIFPNIESFIDDLERWWKLYQGMGLAKRIQAPPILAVKRRAFGFDHRESQMGARFTEEYLKLKAAALA